jgi:hypothetical protein
MNSSSSAEDFFIPEARGFFRFLPRNVFHPEEQACIRVPEACDSIDAVETIGEVPTKTFPLRGAYWVRFIRLTPEKQRLVSSGNLVGGNRMSAIARTIYAIGAA